MVRSKKSYENWGRKCRICGWSKTGLSKKNEEGLQYRWCPQCKWTNKPKSL